MGDAVNLAARLMAKARPGQIVVSPDVLSRSRTSFATEELEPFLVKGKAKPVRAFLLGDVVGEQEVGPADDAPVRRPAGRSSEQLERHLAGAAARRRSAGRGGRRARRRASPGWSTELGSAGRPAAAC